MRGRKTRSERVYEALLLAYPKEYRREYGPLMAQAFGDQCRAERERAGLIGLVLLWVRTILDLFRTAASERAGMTPAGTFVLPVAGSPRMVRWGGLAAICGAVCALVAMVLGDLSIAYTKEPIGNALAAYQDGESSYSPLIVLLQPIVEESLSALAGLFFATAFIGMYALVARRSGRSALWGGGLICLGVAALILSVASNAYRMFVVFGGRLDRIASNPLSDVFAAVVPAYLIGALLLSVAIFRTGALGRWSVLPLLLWLPGTLLRIVLIQAGFPVQDRTQAISEGIGTLAIVHSPVLLTNAAWIVIGYLMWLSYRAVRVEDSPITAEAGGLAAKE